MYNAVRICWKFMHINKLLIEISSSHGGEYDVQSCLLGYTAVGCPLKTSSPVWRGPYVLYQYKLRRRSVRRLFVS
jgi:hypothetical protein